MSKNRVRRVNRALTREEDVPAGGYFANKLGNYDYLFDYVGIYRPPDCNGRGRRFPNKVPLPQNGHNKGFPAQSYNQELGLPCGFAFQWELLILPVRDRLRK